MDFPSDPSTAQQTNQTSGKAVTQVTHTHTGLSDTKDTTTVRDMQKEQLGRKALRLGGI